MASANDPPATLGGTNGNLCYCLFKPSLLFVFAAFSPVVLNSTQRDVPTVVWTEPWLVHQYTSSVHTSIVFILHSNPDLTCTHHESLAVSLTITEKVHTHMLNTCICTRCENIGEVIMERYHLIKTSYCVVSSLEKHTVVQHMRMRKRTSSFAN